MSTFIVGEMLAILPSSNASGAGIGFLNQSTWPRGITSLASIVYCVAVDEDANTYYGKRTNDDACCPKGYQVQWGLPKCIHRNET